MKLKVYSFKHDLLELDVKDTRPKISVCEIYFDGKMHPWNGYWENLVITEFNEDFETVKNKVINFYKDESSNEIRNPNNGSVKLINEEEVWEMPGAKIIYFDADEENKKITLTIQMNLVTYKRN